MATDTAFEYLSIKEAAEILKVNPAFLHKAIKEGRLTATKNLGYGYRTTRPWLQVLVNSLTVNPDAAGSAGGDAA